MAKKITQLNDAQKFSGDENFEVVQDGQSRKGVIGKIPIFQDSETQKRTIVYNSDYGWIFSETGTQDISINDLPRNLFIECIDSSLPENGILHINLNLNDVIPQSWYGSLCKIAIKNYSSYMYLVEEEWQTIYTTLTVTFLAKTFSLINNTEEVPIYYFEGIPLKNSKSIEFIQHRGGDFPLEIGNSFPIGSVDVYQGQTIFSSLNYNWFLWPKTGISTLFSDSIGFRSFFLCSWVDNGSGPMQISGHPLEFAFNMSSILALKNGALSAEDYLDVNVPFNPTLLLESIIAPNIIKGVCIPCLHCLIVPNNYNKKLSFTLLDDWSFLDGNTTLTFSSNWGFWSFFVIPGYKKIANICSIGAT